MLDLDYHPAVARWILTDLERTARRVGLPLDTIELLGQDAQTARKFTGAANRGTAARFLDTIDLRTLDAMRSARRLGLALPMGPFGAALVA